MSDKDQSAKAKPRKVDPHGPVDFDLLKARVAKHGPYSLRSANESAILTLNISGGPDEGCSSLEDVITITQTNGFSTLSTMIERAALEEWESLAALASAFHTEPQRIFHPDAELQYIESEIHTHLGFDIDDVSDTGLLGSGTEHVLSEDCKKDPGRAHSLQVIASILLEHRGMQRTVGDLSGDATIRELFPSPNNLLELMRDHHTVGFLVARLISEYFVQYEIGPLAKKGLAFEEAQSKRTASSGRSSIEKRKLRIESMLTAMERLVLANPDLRRMSFKAVADLAITDAVLENKTLWSQGKGRRDDYLGEMKADLDYRSRFLALQKQFM